MVKVGVLLGVFVVLEVEVDVAVVVLGDTLGVAGAVLVVEVVLGVGAAFPFRHASRSRMRSQYSEDPLSALARAAAYPDSEECM
jgi:hypothetical protein